MKVSDQQQQLLQLLPGVDRLLTAARENPVFQKIPKTVLVRSIRNILEAQRHLILNQPEAKGTQCLSETDLLKKVARQAAAFQTLNLQRTINATGVVVHTNLGRSCLAQAAMEHMLTIGGRYSNLEFDLKHGQRGSRYNAVEDLLCELTGADAAMVVNNNAGAVLLCLDTLAHDKSVILSRGELVEIGGSFRIPDVMAKSGARLKEVGTTNRTHFRDYENAIGNDTGLLLKVHTSNYSIVGFTASVSLVDLVSLGAKFNLPVMEDLGSGNLMDFGSHGPHLEPTVQASVQAGTDVVTFSGDKLLGGPQAGIIVGKETIIDQIKSNPLTRALRIDKLTLAALESTLRLYRDPSQAVAQIPTLRMLMAQPPEIERRARQLKTGLDSLGSQLSVTLLDLTSKVGGGALPLLELPSCCVGISIEGLSANAIEKTMRNHRPAIIARIENDLFILDPRTIQDDELDIIVSAFDHLLNPTLTEDSQ